MSLALNQSNRKLAERLIRATAKDGADATTQLLHRFPTNTWPALIAYLARVACAARDLPSDPEYRPYQHGKPNALTEAQQREAHRAFGKGSRTVAVVIGEREYQRHWARRRREKTADRCPT
jgi:hypothetical protein